LSGSTTTGRPQARAPRRRVAQSARTLIFTIGWIAFVVDAIAVLQRAL